MPNAWVEHIKKYAKNTNLSYSCDLSTPGSKNNFCKIIDNSNNNRKSNNILE